MGELTAVMRGEGADELVDTLRGDDVREDVESPRGRADDPGKLPTRGEAIRWFAAAAAAAAALTAAAAAAVASSVAVAVELVAAGCSGGTEISGGVI